MMSWFHLAKDGTPMPKPMGTWLGPKPLPPIGIDATIAVIIAREMFEGAMFIISHLGSVMKNELLDANTKKVSSFNAYSFIL